MGTVRYFDTPTLLRLIDAGNKRGYNRKLERDYVESIADPAGKHVVIFSMGHDHIGGEWVEPHVRVMFFLKEKGIAEPMTRLTMDMSWSSFNALPEYIVEDQDA